MEKVKKPRLKRYSILDQNHVEVLSTSSEEVALEKAKELQKLNMTIIYMNDHKFKTAYSWNKSNQERNYKKVASSYIPPSEYSLPK